METSFRDDLGADSLDLYELAEMLKDEYDVEIPEEEVGNLLTVGDVIRFLEKHGIE
jgi:acyl carrier protein